MLLLSVFAFFPDSWQAQSPARNFLNCGHALLQPCVCVICRKIIEGMIKGAWCFPASLIASASLSSIRGTKRSVRSLQHCAFPLL